MSDYEKIYDAAEMRGGKSFSVEGHQAGIAAVVAEAKAEALRGAADDWTQGAWANTPRHADRITDRMKAAQYAGDWLRARALAVEREGESHE